MDISPEYIKLCEKAVEIQKEWSPRNGDLFVEAKWDWEETDENTKKKVLTRFYPYEDNSHLKMHGTFCQKAREHPHFVYIWIFRQDQLQEMISSNILTLTDRIYKFLFETPGGKLWDSMEQLWLALVMREKHNKVWNDEKKSWEVMNG